MNKNNVKHMFSFNTHKKPSSLSSHLSFWAPSKTNALLNYHEKESFLHSEDLIESVHIALPSLLFKAEGDKIVYSPLLDLGYYLLVAKLKDSPYLIVYEKRQLKAFSLTKSTFTDRSCYYFDSFFSPGFGGLHPHYFLFEKVTKTNLPHSFLLFQRS